MADHPVAHHPVTEYPAPVRSRRRRPDPVALLVGIVSIAIATLALIAPALLVAVDVRWVLAATAVLVGGGVLLTTVRRR